MRRTLRWSTAVAVVFAAISVIGTGSARGAGACKEVVSAARGIASVARTDASSGAALFAPATYSLLSYDTIPQVAYNQSGPTTTGQLEDPTGTNPQTLAPTVYGFLPVNPPVPPPAIFPDGSPYLPAPPIVGRSEAAYPTLQGIPQDSEGAFGTTQSEAHAHPSFSAGRATTAGLGGPDGGVRQASAFTAAKLECETLTLVLGWEAAGVVTSGGTIPTMSQIATLVVSPAGSSVDVATNVAQETEEGVAVIDGRPLDPLFADFNKNGTYVDVGEPRVSIKDGVVRVEGGGVRYGTRDPSRNDTFTFVTLGSFIGELRLLSVLPGGALPSAPSAPSVTTDTDEGIQTTRIVQRAGDAPSPSEVATGFSKAPLAALTTDLTTGALSLWPLVIGLLALGLLARTGWSTADRARYRFPTAGFAVDWSRARAARFSTSFLRW